MELYKIIIKLIDNPTNQEIYKNLHTYYHQNNLANEAEAVDSIIEGRFNKNDTINHTNINKQ